MNEPCAVCGSRRGQRECPVLSGRICSQCCGRGRRRTIDCPDSCGFYMAGVRQAVARLAAAGGNYDLDQEMADVLHNLRLAIVHARSGLARDPTDEEVRLALANAADTLRTRSKGLVYDFRSPDPRVQSVIDEVMTVAGWHELGGKNLRRVTLAELSSCLRHLEGQARRLMGDNPAGSRFLDLASQSVAQSYLTENGQQAG